MSSIIESVDVDVPVQTAYNQWTQFESFPQFMEGVESITQRGNTMTHWQIDIAGVRRTFDAKITEQHPDERVAWESISGPRHAGVVTFHRLSGDKTRVTLQMEAEPERLVENTADLLGFLAHRVKADLQRFKRFIESRGMQTGAWRGEVQPPHAS
jgi:uncharacterized membrane protein